MSTRGPGFGGGRCDVALRGPGSRERFEEGRGCYGYRRVNALLRLAGTRVSEKRVRARDARGARRGPAAPPPLQLLRRGSLTGGPPTS